MMEIDTANEPTFACDMTAMDAAQRERRQALADQIRTSTQEIRELSNGYAFRLPNDTSLFLLAAEFVTLERLCCPFFQFELALEPELGPLWLRLSGQPGVKRFIETEVGIR